jgi:hypothetical protein
MGEKGKGRGSLGWVLLIALLHVGCASTGRGVREATPAWSARARPGDVAWEQEVGRAYERRFHAPGNPIRRVGGTPERMSPGAFRKWSARHDRRVAAWERRQAGVVARRFGITPEEVLRVYCAVVARRFTEGAR